MSNNEKPEKGKTREQNQIFDFSIRFSNKKYSLENFIDEDYLLGMFRENLNEHGEKWIFQLEDTGDNLHFQAYIKVKERTRLNTFIKSFISREYDQEVDNPKPTLTFAGAQISPASNNGKKILQSYCMKTDTRVAGPWANKNVYMGEDLPNKLLPWQDYILNELKGPVCDRTINWLVDINGCMGKSKFCKFINYYQHGTKLTYGNAKDLLYLVSKYANEQAYIFDLTRTKPKEFSSQDVYACIEEIKNGDFINMKYECEKVLMRVPHIWVFSNSPPDMSNLTQDRWKIWTFSNEDKFTAEIIPYKSKTTLTKIKKTKELQLFYDTDDEVED